MAAYRSPVPELAVGAVCVRDARLLLVLRVRGTAVGRWAVPGGRLEPGDTLETAVLRELAEETGLGGVVTGLCGVAERRGRGYHYVILDYWVTAEGEAVAADDAEAVCWASREDLDRLALVDDLLPFLDANGVLHLLQ